MINNVLQQYNITSARKANSVPVIFSEETKIILNNIEKMLLPIIFLSVFLFASDPVYNKKSFINALVFDSHTLLENFTDTIFIVYEGIQKINPI